MPTGGDGGSRPRLWSKDRGNEGALGHVGVSGNEGDPLVAPGSYSASRVWWGDAGCDDGAGAVNAVPVGSTARVGDGVNLLLPFIRCTEGGGVTPTSPRLGTCSGVRASLSLDRKAWSRGLKIIVCISFSMQRLTHYVHTAVTLATVVSSMYVGNARLQGLVSWI